MVIMAVFIAIIDGYYNEIIELSEASVIFVYQISFYFKEWGLSFFIIGFL